MKNGSKNHGSLIGTPLFEADMWPGDVVTVHGTIWRMGPDGACKAAGTVYSVDVAKATSQAKRAA